MKLLLINPSSHTRYPIPPLGLLQLASDISMHGHIAFLNDLNVSPLDYNALIECDAVGITAVTPNINEAVELSKEIQEQYPRKTIIVGGPHATILPEETLEAGSFDMALVGEADVTLPMLLDTLEGELPIDDVPNLYCKSGDYIWHTELQNKPVDMSTLPMPDCSLLDISKYRPHVPHGRKKPWLPMITSRGCPYSCTFCSKPVFGSKYRALTAGNVVNQLSVLKDKHGVKEVAFYDDVFTMDFHRAYDICEGIRRANLDIDWSCETRVNLVGAGILKDLRGAGCFLIAYGIESGSQNVLSSLNKGISLEQIEEAIAHTREVGIQTVGYFMLGNPSETEEDIDQTINFAIKLKLDYAQFAITVPLPGSKLYEQYIAGGNEPPDWSSFSYMNMGQATTPMFSTNGLSAETITHLLAEANRRFYLRPGYMWQRAVRALKSPAECKLLWNGVKTFAENMRAG